MASILSSFLSSTVGSSGNLRDYRHAEQLYGGNSFTYFPKTGWLYYVVFNVNKSLNINGDFSAWCTKHSSVAGALAKKVALPKFSIQTETLNQYNKKTVVQKQIVYNPVSITLHDDSANATQKMWEFYYLYYFSDARDSSPDSLIQPKYKVDPYEAIKQYKYGLNTDNTSSDSFFTSIDIYQLHNREYTSFKLVNPKIKEWIHDQLDQTQGASVLASQMVVDYEAVIYGNGSITSSQPGFMSGPYDKTPSPLNIAGGGSSSVFGPGGLVPGAVDVFGSLSKFGETGNPLDLMSAAIKGANVLKNAKNLTASGIKQEGVGILMGMAAPMALSAVSSIGSLFKKPVSPETDSNIAVQKQVN